MVVGEDKKRGRGVFEPGVAREIDSISWSEFQSVLSATLLDLGKGCFVIVDVLRLGVDPDSAERPGGLRRLYRTLTGRPPAAVQPFVQFRRIDWHLMCEVSGPAELGGPVLLSSEQQAQIVELGWAEPVRNRDKTFWGVANYRAYFPHDEVPARIHGAPLPGAEYRAVVDTDWAAGLAVETLRGPLGAESPQQLRVERSP